VIFVRRVITVAILSAVLLIPANALGQTSDRIAILDNLGEYQRGEGLFVFGTVANVVPESFVILQIVNPNGDLCQIQQLTPLSNGVFMTETIHLSGSICGVEGSYDIKLFYGDYAKTSSFTVSGTGYHVPTDGQLFDNASALVAAKIQSISERSELDLSEYTDRLSSASGIGDLERLYVDLWEQFIIEDAILDVNPIFRPAVISATDSAEKLLSSGEISLEVSKGIDRTIYSAIFYYGIGDADRAVDVLNDTFTQIKNVDPIKIPASRQLTFAELEETLLNLMTKTDTVMSSQVKEEVAFILARGTAPLFADDISDLVDLLSKSRYLDVVSRKDTPVYRLVNIQWDSIRESLPAKTSMAELLEPKSKVDDLHAAALLLRQLDRVDRFISSDDEENSELASILKPEWDGLSSSLQIATSVQSILDAETDIINMKNVIDISSRVSKSVEIAQDAGVNVEYVNEWQSLLDRVENANSFDEILGIVSEFDSSISEMRDKRNPLSSLKFEFEQLKQKAEIQADYENLALINQALRIIHSAELVEDGAPVNSKIDRAEVLLTWASQIAPSVRSDLERSSGDASEEKAGDILQRAKSIENLADLSLRKNKFLPGFTDFTDSVNDRLERVRSLVMQNDLDAADAMVRELFKEWSTVSGAYTDDPHGSPVGYSLDELQRIEYREQLEDYSSVVSTFYNSDFDAHSPEYHDMVSDAYSLIEIGNFIDAEDKIKSIGKYLSDHLPLRNSRILYDISYDQERDIWVLKGAVDKLVMDRRENLHVTVYDMDGNRHSSLEFTDTRQGDFFTQWEAPTEPGLYIVMIQYQNVQASQIVHVDDKEIREPRLVEVNSVELAREFEELESFIEEFGGPNESHPRITSVVDEIKSALANRNPGAADDKIEDLELLIERYLPVRSRSAVIETQYDGNVLVISGAVQKMLAFSEDLFVDIYDQQGNLVESVALRDNSGGMFTASLSVPFDPGVHVAQLEYHDLTVTDFFTVP